MSAGDTLKAALGHITGDRAKTHGDAARNHDNIATMWNAFLKIRRDPDAPLTRVDVAIMQTLLKVARTQLGDFNSDDYEDGAAYLDLGHEISPRCLK